MYRRSRAPGLCRLAILPPGNRARPTSARTFLFVDWYEHLHTVVVAQLLEVPSTENVVADGLVAHHHDALAREGPDIAVSVDYSSPVPVTPRGNTYILFFTDRFSRRPDIFESLRLSSPLRARLTFSSTGALGIFRGAGLETPL